MLLNMLVLEVCVQLQPILFFLYPEFDLLGFAADSASCFKFSGSKALTLVGAVGVLGC